MAGKKSLIYKLNKTPIYIQKLTKTEDPQALRPE
jgi:hypothetical protein